MSIAGCSTTSISRPARSAGSATIHAGGAAAAGAPEELVRLGNAGHRRRARLRVPRLRRAVRVRHERQAGLVEADGRAKMRTGWGSAASPVLHDGRLYIVNDNEERSFIAAFDARTGERAVAHRSRGEGSNWSTPFVWQNDRRTEIVTTGTEKGALVRHQRQAALGARPA